MPSDVFIISTSRNPSPAAALQLALEQAGVNASQIEDAVFGVDGANAGPDLDASLRGAGLNCPAATVSPSLRGLFYAAASLLSGDVELSLAVVPGAAAVSAFVLASPEAVGRLNLFPRARMAARSLSGSEAALLEAGVNMADLEIRKTGGGGVLSDLLDELEALPARWGLITDGALALLVERL